MAYPVTRDDASAAFFDGARDGVLLIQRCAACGHEQFALTGLSAGVDRCRHCGAPDPAWVPAAGTGRVETFTVIPARPGKDGAVPPPAIAAVVELDEGPWVTAPLDARPGDVRAGARVSVSFRAAEGDGEPLPVFVLA